MVLLIATMSLKLIAAHCYVDYPPRHPTVVPHQLIVDKPERWRCDYKRFRRRGR